MEQSYDVKGKDILTATEVGHPYFIKCVKNTDKGFSRKELNDMMMGLLEFQVPKKD